MVFASNAFLFLFLPLFLLAYFAIPNRNRWRNVVILLGSWAFYGWWRLDFLALFIALTAFNYAVGLAIGRHGARSDGARRWVRFGVLVDLAVLGYFKYSNFGVDTFNELMVGLGHEPVTLAKVILPIGISFYTFESISYIVDVYRGSVKATRHPVDFATFVGLFPHLIVGPIFRYRDLEQQFAHREHSLELVGQGAVRFMQGFIKKVLIADTLAPLTDVLFALPDPSTGDAWLAALSYGAQLYFDFSGYSDMAVGLGLMMGFRFVENFNKPFLAQSTTEFWRRWHISLSNWLRDYVFYSMGSGRKTKLKIQWMVFVTFLVGGIWHGANWTFILWGLVQGSVMAVERGLGVNGVPAEFKWRRWLPSFLFSFGLGMILFRSPSLSDAWRLYQPMLFTRHIDGLSDPVTSVLSHLQLVTLAVAVTLVVLEGLREWGPKLSLGSPRFRSQAALWLLAPLFVIALGKLLAQGYSAFLYFQF